MAKKKRRKRRRRNIATSRKVSRSYDQSGQFFFSQGDYAAAVKAWRVAVKANPEIDLNKKLAEAHFRHALCLDRSRKITQVISELHQAIARAPNIAIYHFHLGLAYHYKGQYDHAISAYQQALKLKPGDSRFKQHLQIAQSESDGEAENATARIMQLLQRERNEEAVELLGNQPPGKMRDLLEGFAYAKRGDYAEAKKCLNRCSASEYATIASYYLGLIYAHEARFPSAMKNLEVAMTEPSLKNACQPILLGVYRRQGMKYIQSGEPDKANRLWNKIARLDPQDVAADNAVAAALEDGYRSAAEGDFAKAMRSWKRLINQGIDHPALLQNYAIACDRTDNYENAMDTWAQLAQVWEKQQVRASDPTTLKRKLALVYRRLGELAWHFDDAYCAKEMYERALKYAPQDVELHLRLVTLLMEFGDYNALFHQLRQLRRKHPDNPRVLEIMISAHLEMHDYTKALQCAMDLLKLDKNHQNSRQLLQDLGGEHVRSLFKNNQRHEGMRLLQALIRADSNYPPFHALLGEVYLSQRKEHQAQETLQRCIEVSEDKALAHAQVGKVYMMAEYLKRAEAHFKEALDRQAEQANILLTIASAYMSHDMHKAEQYLDRLILYPPEDSEVFADIADELIDAEKPQTALKILEFGLEMFPDAVPLLMGKISAAITMQDFDLMREVLQSLRELALETDNFDVLEAISALEMILTFQNTLGGLFGYDDDDWYDEPF